MTALRPDTHLAPLERAQLGARANAYGSREVIRLFNKLQQVGLLPKSDKPTPVAQWQTEESFKALEDQIKKELRGYAPWRERRRERE